MRLLVLLPAPPRLDASDGGRRVSAQLLHRLAGRHRVALLCLRGPNEPPVCEELRAVCDLVEEVPRPTNARSAPGQWWRRARHVAGWASGQPMWATDWFVPLFAQRLRVLARSWAADIVQAEFHVMGQYLTVLGADGPPRVLVEHEPGVTAAYDTRGMPRQIGRIMVGLERAAWRRYEKAQLATVQAVIAFTERDTQTLAKLRPRVPVLTIPFGIDCPPQAMDPNGEMPPTLLFVGHFGHPPNVDAAIWLTESILPGVLSRHPEVRLVLVGDQPPGDLCCAGGDTEAVLVTGRVPHVERYLEAATIVVAPLRVGGGMRVKVADALAAGKALVATRLAVAGLDVVDGQQVLLAETADEFIARISQLLGDPFQRAALGRQAREWALANLDWERPIARYEALYQRLSSNRMRE